MRYVGGKYRLGKEISEVLVKFGNPSIVNGYAEPFCGSLGVTRHMIEYPYKKIYISDLCKDLILLWKAVKNDTFVYPKKLSEKSWRKYKASTKPSALRAFVGFGCSFGGRWFNGYAPKHSEKAGRSVLQETTRAVQRLNPVLKKINKIKASPYDSLSNRKLKRFLIYCDPPYSSTLGYDAIKDKFNSEKFWKQVREWSKYNIVIVSEFNAPRDFKCIWMKKRVNKVCRKITSSKMKLVEKLFIYRPLFNKLTRR